MNISLILAGFVDRHACLILTYNYPIETCFTIPIHSCRLPPHRIRSFRHGLKHGCSSPVRRGASKYVQSILSNKNQGLQHSFPCGSGFADGLSDLPLPFTPPSTNPHPLGKECYMLGAPPPF